MVIRLIHLYSFIIPPENTFLLMADIKSKVAKEGRTQTINVIIVSSSESFY